MITIDTAKVDQAALALLYLTLHQGNRAWKNIDFDRLYEQDLIDDPASRAKSVILTEAGVRRCEEAARTLFEKR